MTFVSYCHRDKNDVRKLIRWFPTTGPTHFGTYRTSSPQSTQNYGWRPRC